METFCTVDMAHNSGKYCSAGIHDCTLSVYPVFFTVFMFFLIRNDCACVVYFYCLMFYVHLVFYVVMLLRCNE